MHLQEAEVRLEAWAGAGGKRGLGVNHPAPPWSRGQAWSSQRCFMAADQEFIFAAKPQASFAVPWAL